MAETMATDALPINFSPETESALNRLGTTHYQQVHSALVMIVETYKNKINAASIVATVLVAMKTVGPYKQLLGTEKRRIVIEVITRIIDESVPEKVAYLRPLLAELVGPTIDTFIDVENGKIVLDKDLKAGLVGLRSVLCCGSGARMPTEPAPPPLSSQPPTAATSRAAVSPADDVTPFVLSADAEAALAKLNAANRQQVHAALELSIATFKNKIHPASVVTCVLVLMRTVGPFKQLTGMEKRRIVIEVINRIVDESVPEKVEYLKPLINELVGPVIDNLIDIEKGKVVIDADIKAGLLSMKGFCCGGSAAANAP